MKQPLLYSCMGPYVESPDSAGLAAAKALSRKALRELLDTAEEHDSLGTNSSGDVSDTGDLA